MAIYNQAQLDALSTAIAQGALEVAYGSKRVRYRSLADMLRLQAAMQADIAGESTGSSYHYPRFVRD